MHAVLHAWLLILVQLRRLDGIGDALLEAHGCEIVYAYDELRSISLFDCGHDTQMIEQARRGRAEAMGETHSPGPELFEMRSARTPESRASRCR